MFEMGAAVDCAIENNIFGATTMDRFANNLSGYYGFWAFGQFFYYTFIRNLILTAIYLASMIPFTFGIAGWLYAPFNNLSDYIPLFTTLYMTNAAYESFHPTVAPELSF